MTLSEELSWRGLVNQTTYKDLKILDQDPITFYWGVDPSADSMTIGNLAPAMMVKHFIKQGHRAVLLVGGATGQVGDPDGKSEERALLSLEQINANKQALVKQYAQVFEGLNFKIVDNFDWFKDMHYLEFLRDIGKHAPLSQMIARDFIQKRLGEHGSGISYAEFSYALVQAYDYLVLYKDHGVTLQVCGADQWGNCIAGVDLIRRKTGGEANIFSVPLITNKTTGQKFGKSEAGAIWLDAGKTTPTQFYQFWINVDDQGVDSYLKVFTELDKPAIDDIMLRQTNQPEDRVAQTALAQAVTKLVHGEDQMKLAEAVTKCITGQTKIGEASDIIEALRQELASVKANDNGSIVEVLVSSGLAESNTEARRLIKTNAISLNGIKVNREQFIPADFNNGRLLVRRGKAFKDTALVELK